MNKKKKKHDSTINVILMSIKCINTMLNNPLIKKIKKVIMVKLLKNTSRLSLHSLKQNSNYKNDKYIIGSNSSIIT